MPPKYGEMDTKSIVAPKPRKSSRATQQISHILMGPLQSDRITALCEKYPSFNDIVNRYCAVHLWLTVNGYSSFLSVKASFIEANLSFYEFSKPPTAHVENLLIVDIFSKWENHCHGYASDQVLRAAMKMFPMLRSLMIQSDRVDEWMEFNGLSDNVSREVRLAFISAHKPQYIKQCPNASRSEVTGATIEAWCDKTMAAARTLGYPNDDDLPQ